jgi:hypothetical protein
MNGKKSDFKKRCSTRDELATSNIRGEPLVVYYTGKR